jgi:cysteine desulfurase / selenocysteine lyase
MNIQKIRKQIPILDRKINSFPLVYFDNAATTQKPLRVLDSMMAYYKGSNANVHRAIHTLSYESTKLWEEAHTKVAKFLNAKSDKEIFFTKNATESLNFFAQAYGRQSLKEGDVIAISEMEHHSNILPWQQLAKEKKLKLEWIPVLEDFQLDISYLEYLIRKYKDRFKILSVTQVSNVLGVVNDVKLLAKKVHKFGGIICVDATQSVAHMPVDVQDLDCDFLCFSGHKIYGPMGIGVVYGKEEILNQLDPWMTGGDTVSKVWKNGATWSELPMKFESGTGNIEAAVGLSEAIDFLNQYSWEEIQKHERKLTSVALAGLLSVCNLDILGPKNVENRIGVLSFRLKNLHPHDIASLLDEKGIAVRAGFHCAEPLHNRFDFGPTARVSFALYNTVEEVSDFINEIKKISRI